LEKPLDDRLKELRSEAREAYQIYFGCLYLEFKDKRDNNITALGIHEKLNHLFKQQKLVTSIDISDLPMFAPGIYWHVIGQGMDSEFNLKREIKRFSVDPVIVNLDYTADTMKPDFFKHLYKHDMGKYPMKATLFYDGLLYLLGIQILHKHEDIHYLGQAVGLHRWLFNLLSQEDAWSVGSVNPSPFSAHARLYMVDESMVEQPDREVIPQLRFEGMSPFFMQNFSYPAHDYGGEGEVIQEDINDAIEELWIEIGEMCTDFYHCQTLFNEIESQNTEARKRIRQVSKAAIHFHDISFLNVRRRFKESKRISKDLAYLYVLMPAIEMLNNEYEVVKSRLEASGRYGGSLAFCEMLKLRLPRLKDSIFTQGVREMLSQDVAEIRTQVNHQLLLISVIIALLTVIVGVIFGTLR